MRYELSRIDPAGQVVAVRAWKLEGCAFYPRLTMGLCQEYTSKGSSVYHQPLIFSTHSSLYATNCV